MKKKYWTFTERQVVSIDYKIIAETEEEARKKYEAGNCGYPEREEVEESELLEVTGPHEIEIYTITTEIKTEEAGS